MFGYATDETEECMPLTVVLAHALNRRISDMRKQGALWWARPDSKTQVSTAPPEGTEDFNLMATAATSDQWRGQGDIWRALPGTPPYGTPRKPWGHSGPSRPWGSRGRLQCPKIC